MDLSHLPSPAFVLYRERLVRNLELIQSVAQKADVSIILALKAYSFWPTFPLIGQYLNGATASSLNEARLIFEEMGVKAHTYAPVYMPDEFDALLTYSSHLTFNSISQFLQYREKIRQYDGSISCGLRVNPGYSPVEVDLYNPASSESRLGVGVEALKEGLPNEIEGLHFHVLCESSAIDLERVLEFFEHQFGHLFAQIKWVNFGGGHLITRKGYDIDHLVQILKAFKARHHLEVMLEPGSAIAWQTGVLIATVLDIVENGGVKTAMVDASFTAHMPDTLEMPYRPIIREATTEPQAHHFQYRIGGTTCLAGDYMEKYGFDTPLKIGDRLIFEDMMHYTTVKTTMFNGVKHPAICVLDENGQLEYVKRFTYEDYKNRMG